ncbi:MAG: hypothetical protein COA69_06560 [Robiginitomaculum sp.]|nr:MAG: hypothetical protein COA69_06560 [Robiginitomaculum sp.]
MKEIKIRSLSGILVLLGVLVLVPFVIWFMVHTGSHPEMSKDMKVLRILGSGVGGGLLALLVLSGLYKVEPNQSVVLSLFGKYIGTNRNQGLHCNNPFMTKKKVSLRVRNFESGRMKVNDSGGSPIEIAAIVVWEVDDSAEAVFKVDDYESFVQIQSEAAIRSMATSHPYEPHEDGDVSLRSHPAEVSEHMKKEIQARLSEAGINVIEARLSHLAYAPEIAHAMLQRQQAGAIIAARQQIVEGAVGMVEMALNGLKERGVVDLDEERQAAMVSNLLVVLCSQSSTQPVINTGSIY